MEPLNEFERAVLTSMLEGDDPVSTALRSQLAVVAVRHRKFTGVGFFTDLAVPADTLPAPTSSGVPALPDVGADIEGLRHGAGFVLFLENGFLHCLEGYTYGEAWPARVVRFTVRPEAVMRPGKPMIR
jgi:hypothetical protein